MSDPLPAPKQVLILWTNYKDGNAHYLVAHEMKDGKWQLTLIVHKPCGTGQRIECEERIECTAVALIDAFRDLGPTWVQRSETPGDDYHAERDAPVPGTALKVRWKVHHDKTSGSMVLDDSLQILAI